ncbi:MAG: hypothetical protein FI687_01975 [SAR202 cluster bacterium]|nr:hypothetical protein [SAR202 cluster bacterium]|tara:strand:- start:58772 stop:60124 length:1353 start_codon:yes stop_codon:yes gene_type:complete
MVLRYKDAIKSLSSLINFERSLTAPNHSQFHIERMTLLMDLVGKECLEIPTIHVAGTNGKGSVSSIIASILNQEGYLTGLYTSPSLHKPTERIRLAQNIISEDDFADIFFNILESIEKVHVDKKYGEISYFEAITAMAFLYFKKKNVDIQIIEVGLGGRLDATNVVFPSVSVITPIGLDHVGTLGDTIQKIAFEKSGIIKKEIPVVVAPQNEDAFEVIANISKSKNSEIISVEKNYSWRRTHFDFYGQKFILKRCDKTFDLFTNNLASYQMENIATAISVIDVIKDQGMNVSDKSIKNGVAKFDWSGRLEVLQKDTNILIADGSHNAHGMEKTLKSIKKDFDFEEMIVVLGVLRGHNLHGISEQFIGINSKFVAVNSREPRALPSSDVFEILQSQGLNLISFEATVFEGIQTARIHSSKNSLILVTGSLSVAAEAIQHVKQVEFEIYPDI